MPITDIEEIAEIYKTPMLISQIWMPWAKAMGARMSIETTMTRKGARLNKNLSAPSGVKPSLSVSLRVSASVCKVPPGPTRLGPWRICIYAETFLSINTRTKPSTAKSATADNPTRSNSTDKATLGLKLPSSHPWIARVMCSRLNILFRFNFFVFGWPPQDTSKIS